MTPPLFIALSPLTRWGLVIMTAAMALSVVRFVYRQRSGGVGGKLSTPKALWLLWAILNWFFVCPLLSLDVHLPMGWRLVLGIFAINMWCRGLIELYMLYVTKSWRPPYGITHNIWSVILLLGAIAYHRPPVESGWALGGALWAGVIGVSMVIETYYAVAFHHVVEGQTTGDDGIWFADAEDPKFRRINQITTVLNIPLYLAFIALLILAWGVMP